MFRPSSERVRGSYIGGPAAVAIAGLNPYQTPLEVYASIVLGHEVRQTPRMLRGLICEPGLLSYVEEQRGQVLTRDAFYVDDRHAFMRCSCDAVEGDHQWPAIVHSCKTTLARSAGKWGTSGSDEVDPYAGAQVQWEMGITHAREAHLWLMILDADEVPRHYVVPRNEALITELRARAETFWWDHVMTSSPPPAQAHEAIEAVQALYAEAVEGKSVILDDESAMAAHAYDAARTTAKMVEEKKDEAAAALMAVIGDAERATWAGGSATWKPRVLKPQTDWEQVAHEIAMKYGVPGEAFNGFVKEQTRGRKSGRVLTVTIKKQPTEKNQ